MILYDSLYGSLRFPKMIEDLLSCPGLLRLKDIRMSNIPVHFSSAFASISRFEHSLGVCRLANIFSEIHGLSKKDSYELMIASLYHDVGTPPFAHLFEEILNDRFDFNHELHIKDVLLSKSKDLGKKHLQIYEGHSLKLIKLQGKGIDIERVSNLIVGSDNDGLGRLICSDFIDLDNIDNILRSFNAISPQPGNRDLFLHLLKNFDRQNNRFVINKNNKPVIDLLTRRKYVYDAIYNSIIDYGIEIMLYEALNVLFESNLISSYDWKMTETEIKSIMLRDKCASIILKKINLLNIYQCLFLFKVNTKRDIDITAIAIQIRDTAADFIAVLTKDKKVKSIKYKDKDFYKIRIDKSSHLRESIMENTRRIVFIVKKDRSSKSNVTTSYIIGIFSTVKLYIKREEKDLLVKDIISQLMYDVELKYQF